MTIMATAVLEVLNLLSKIRAGKCEERGESLVTRECSEALLVGHDGQQKLHSQC